MIADPRKFYIGVGLLAFFAVVLVIFFLPVLDGKNPMTYLDSLYNSISKQSAYHIPELKQQTARQRATGGSGLGLSIARELVQLMGGTIGARSDGPGKGALFHFDLTGVAEVPRMEPDSLSGQRSP